MNKFDLKFLGTRGSAPVHGKKFEVFGGATSCVFVKLNNTVIVLDAGSGFMSLEDENLDGIDKINLIFSHTHADHVIGLPVNSLLYNEEKNIDIYGYSHYGVGIKEQINNFMKPPIWPVNTDAFSSKVNFYDIKEKEFFIDDIKINILNGYHPDGAILIKLTYDEKTLVYATDCEIEDYNMDDIVKFSKNADILICDGQYDESSIERYKGFGHSSWQRTVAIAKLANVKKLAVFHHEPTASDEMLFKTENEAKEMFENAFFAKMGEGVSL